MKLNDIVVEAKEPKEYVVIGNPGRSQSSSLYPETRAPKLYTKTAADKLAAKLNDKPKLTYGAVPSQVHWHVKHIDKADEYILGGGAMAGLQTLRHHRAPSDAGWGHGPAGGRF